LWKLFANKENRINTAKRKKGEKTGGEELGYSSGLRKLEARSGFCLRLSFHWGTSFAGDLGGFLWGRRDTD
jgi:hypothetical protein